MSTGIKLDLQITQGESFSQNIALSNLSGVSGYAGLKFKYSDSGTIANFGVQFVPLSGCFILSLTATGSAALPSFNYLWDTEFINSNLTVSKPFYGVCSVFPQVY